MNSECKNKIQTEDISNHTTFFNVLKAITLLRDPKAQQATKLDVNKALCFFNLTQKQNDILGKKVKNIPSEDEFINLIDRHHNDIKITLEPAIKSKLSKLLGQGELIPRYPNVLTRMKIKQIYNSIVQAVTVVPGQEVLARSLAIDLATQLSRIEPETTTRSMIHGKNSWGLKTILNSVASVLVSVLDYKVLHIDCSAYRNAGEGASWAGSKSYWSGSNTGEITSFIYRNPKAVICFHNMDETLPSVMATLRSALIDGKMIDYHGLEINEHDGNKKRKPTEVDCRKAVFLCGVSHGCHWLNHPQAETILGKQYSQKKNNLFDELSQATKEYRNEQVSLFDPIVLQEFQVHYNLMSPICWEYLYEKCNNSWDKFLDYVENNIGITIKVIEKDKANLAKLALLQHGGNMNLSHADAMGMYYTFIEPIIAEYFSDEDKKNHHTATIFKIDNSQYEILHNILLELGEQPDRMLKRKNQFVDFDCSFDENKNEISISNITLRKTHRLADYTGNNGLVSHIPKETFVNVVGHKRAKVFLKEIIHYLKNPSILQKYDVKTPRGVLLYGSPGTGKTLIARALAGEASLPFISVTGSEMLDLDFINRVYDIAHRCEPCIIHIDEADVLGIRGKHSHVHDAAVNLLLSKIDGFAKNNGIFHVLTTNRPYELDAALTRSGRIDQSFMIEGLDYEGRKALLEDLWALLKDKTERFTEIQQFIIKQCYGMTGSQLNKLKRELVLRLEREHKSNIKLHWVTQEINNLQHGSILHQYRSDSYKRRVAVHEAGHAVLHSILFPEIPIAQLSIIPREQVSGFMSVEQENRQEMDDSLSTIRSKISVLLGGRAAEILEFDKDGLSTGSSDDLSKATELAWKAVAYSGLDDELGSVSLAGLEIDGQLPVEIHNKAVNQVRYWLDRESKNAQELLKKHQQGLSVLTESLLKNEILNGKEVYEVLAQYLPKSI